MSTFLARNVRAIALSLITVVTTGWSVVAHGNTPLATAQPAVVASEATDPRFDRARILARLESLRAQIQDREIQLRALRRATRGLQAASLDEEQKRLLAQLPRELERLQASFRQIAVNGLDLSVLSPAQTEKYDWEAELIEIVRPVIGSMKSLTEKPRRIEALRQNIRRSDMQQQTLNKALQALSALETGKTGAVGKPIKALRQRWQRMLDQAISARQLYQYQLETLEKGDETSAWESAHQQLLAFLNGRGITLAIWAATVAVIWLIARALLALALKLTQSTGGRTRRSRERAMRYLYRAISVLIVVGASLAVFYLRSDMLLLALSIIGLVMAAAGLRQAVPRYITEIRILLGFGSVREGERMIYNGIPMQVRSINAFAKLENPLLDGVIRIALNSLTGYSSRAVGNEPWFPCEPGDYLLLDGSRFAQVTAQSVDAVQLRVLGSPIQMATTQFLSTHAVNLSREGFLISISFGLDYRHQDICLTDVPDRLQHAVQAAMDESDLAGHCESVTVEFKEAAASSLDYLVLVRFAGAAAGSYFAIQRRIQRALVAACNQAQWIIPFGQLTVHAGDGFGMHPALPEQQPGGHARGTTTDPTVLTPD